MTKTLEAKTPPGARYIGTNGKRTYATRIVDAVPEFAMIPKEQLHVDHGYQRNLNERRVQKMLATWSWAACGALKVALRPTGDWYVFDGQHRHAAAMKLPTIATLPCLIYEMETAEVEARGFLSQTDVKPMTTIDRFRALVAAKDPRALMVRDLLAKHHIALRGGVRRGENAVACAAELLFWADRDPETLSRVFPLAVELLHAGGLISDRLLRAMIHVERHLDGESLTDRRWSKIVLAVGHDAIMDAIRRVIELEGSGSLHNCATGLLIAINRGRRVRLIARGINSNTGTEE